MNILYSDLLTITSILTILIGLIGFFLQIYRISRRDAKQIAEENNTLAKAESRILEEPEKVKPAWDLARVTLEAYFSRNLRQINSIYWLSVFVMLLGFLIIMFGIYQVSQKPEVITPAILAG